MSFSARRSGYRMGNDKELADILLEQIQNDYKGGDTDG